jgi:nicotinamide-nucleotide amidase
VAPSSVAPAVPSSAAVAALSPVAVAAEVLDLLVARGQTLAVAESLTGGLLAATLVDVPGASRAFRGGLVVYATDLKASLAGVADELLRAVGPVDPQVAVALARGARIRCGADWGLATTGVAGPDPQDGVPVGTVYVAVTGPAESGPADAKPSESGSPAGPALEAVRRLDLTGLRAQIRVGAVAAALDLLVAALRRTSAPGEP